jgi:hypothetical protein
MENDNDTIDTVTFLPPEDLDMLEFKKKSRVRKVNWVKILEIMDSKPGEWALIGEFDQSLATHIRKHRYSYIDPSLYQVTCVRGIDMKRNRGHLYMRRIENT